MKRAIILVGIPASGKTTWAIDYIEKALQKNQHPDDLIYIFSRNDLRHHIAHSRGLSKDDKVYVPAYEPYHNYPHIRMMDQATNLWDVWDMGLEPLVTEQYWTETRRVLETGRDVILDNTHIKVNDVLSTIREIEKYNYVPYLKFFPVDLDLALIRDQNRLDPVGKDVILRQNNHWTRNWANRIDQVGDEVYAVGNRLPCRLLCD